MALTIITPPWPLSSGDGDWLALDGSLTRHQAASEIAYNLKDWWLDDYTFVDDEDNIHGWVSGYRKLLALLNRGFIRPYEPGDFDWNSESGPGWWYESNPDHPFAVAAWIWKGD